MKSRANFLVIIGLIALVFGIALFMFLRRNQEPAQIFSATASRDCAPWDGGAFTVLIQYDSVTIITISIWQSPYFPSPTSVTFPDETGQVGNAYTIPELGPYTELMGEVSFERVEQGMPIEGQFKLKSENGVEFAGRFVAAWEHQIVLCG